MDGGAGAGLGYVGRTDTAGAGCAGGRGRLLRAGALPSRRPDRGDSVRRAELAGRQPGWDAGAGARPAEAALRFLRRSHGGHLRVGRVDVRARLLRTAALADGDRDAGRVSDPVERELPGDVYGRALSAFARPVWAYGDSHARSEER